jgi:hypothetical protein
VFLADELRFNRDPFDALICAAARAICPSSRATLTFAGQVPSRRSGSAIERSR